MGINFKDLANLNNSFDNLGSTIMQNRMLAEQKAERGQSRQDRLDENATSRADRLGEQSKLDEYRQQMLKQQMARTAATTQNQDATQQTRQLDEHRKWLETLAKLNASGSMDDDQRKQVNDELTSDPMFSAGGIHFQFKAPTAKSEKLGSSAVAEALMQAEQWRQKAMAAENPEDKARYLKYANTLEKSTPSELKQTPQAKEAPPDRTTVITGQDNSGNPMSRTNTTTYAKPPLLPGQLLPKPAKTNDPLNLFGK
jgi:hypothetical protein